MRLRREILKSYYDHVPLVINSGYVQDSRGLATCEPLRCGFAATNSRLYYDHVPFVINSGYAQNSRGLFGPSGADHKKAQDGCQNGQLWLSAFIRTVPTESQPGDKWKQRSSPKKCTRPTALCVGADPDRAARCEILP